MQTLLHAYNQGYLLLKFHQSIRQRIGNVIVQYRLFNINAPLVITFPPNSAGINELEVKEGVHPWGFNFFTKQQINVISFTHIGKREYFRSIELQNFIKDLENLLSVFPERIGYGVSLGGFAISLHANALKLDRALLMMPLSTYSPHIAPWEPKAVTADKATQYSGCNDDAVVCKVPLTIIYDPLYKTDRLHVERYSCHITRLKLSGVGHRIPRALQELGLLKSTVLDFVHNRLDQASFPDKVRNRRELSYYYKSLLSNSTGKLTFKRRKIIYYHKALWKLKHIEDEPRRIVTRFTESLLKRVHIKKRLNIDLEAVMPIKTLVMSNMFIFC